MNEYLFHLLSLRITIIIKTIPKEIIIYLSNFFNNKKIIIWGC